VVGASQKALMVGPGVSWVGLGTRAQTRLAEGRGAGRFYLDLRRQEKQASGRAGFTPPVDLVIALLEALRYVQDDVGLERFERNAVRQAAALRAGVAALGLSLLPEYPTPSLSTVLLPDGVDGGAFLKRLESAWGVKAAGGQGPLKGKVFRVAHMGYYDLLDTLGCVAAVERTMHDLDLQVRLGSGLSAAQEAAWRFDHP